MSAILWAPTWPGLLLFVLIPRIALGRKQDLNICLTEMQQLSCFRMDPISQWLLSHELPTLRINEWSSWWLSWPALRISLEMYQCIIATNWIQKAQFLVPPGAWLEVLLALLLAWSILIWASILWGDFLLEKLHTRVLPSTNTATQIRSVLCLKYLILNSYALKVKNSSLLTYI